MSLTPLVQICMPPAHEQCTPRSPKLVFLPACHKYQSPACKSHQISQQHAPPLSCGTAAFCVVLSVRLAHTGMPRLTLGVTWDARRSSLLLALRQSGARPVLCGALRAAELPAGAAPGSGAAPGCALRVVVRELDGHEEHLLQVGAADPLGLHELRVVSRLGEARGVRRAARGGRRGGGAAGGGGPVVDDVDVAEAELRGVPVLWVQVRSQCCNGGRTGAVGGQ